MRREDYHLSMDDDANDAMNRQLDAILSLDAPQRMTLLIRALHRTMTEQDSNSMKLLGQGFADDEPSEPVFLMFVRGNVAPTVDALIDKVFAPKGGDDA